MTTEKKFIEGRVLQQTIFQKAENVTNFLETDKEGEENFKGTSFDEMVMDFENSIADEHQIIGKHIFGAGDFVFCTIFYVDKSVMNRKISPAQLKSLSLD